MTASIRAEASFLPPMAALSKAPSTREWYVASHRPQRFEFEKLVWPRSSQWQLPPVPQLDGPATHFDASGNATPVMFKRGVPQQA